MLRYLFILVLIGGCAQPTTQRPTVTLPELQQEITFQAREEFSQRMEWHERVQQITDRLLEASLPICNKTELGYRLSYFDRANMQHLNPVDQALFLDYMGWELVEDYPIIWKDQGLLKQGDKILDIRGMSVKAEYQPGGMRKGFMGPAYAVKGKWIDTVGRALEDAPKLGRIPIRVQRRVDYIDVHSRGQKYTYKDTVLELSIEQKEVCSNQAFVVAKSEVNAYTDGSSIFITTGMLKFASNEELALVIAHELGHCFESHVDKKRANSILGGLIGTFFDIMAGTVFGGQTDEYRGAGAQIGVAAFSQAFELEADYVGLYLLARAGYPTENAAAFWRKMAERDPLKSNDLIGTHPPSAERYLLLAKTHEEIEQKIANGQELLPNRVIANE